MIHMIHLEYMILALVVIASTFLVANAMVDTTQDMVQNVKLGERVDNLLERIDAITSEMGVNTTQGNLTQIPIKLV